MSTNALSEYERSRLERIQQNEQILAKLGLFGDEDETNNDENSPPLSSSLLLSAFPSSKPNVIISSVQQPKSVNKKRKRFMAVSKEEEAIKKGLVRRRASRRLKGDDPEFDKLQESDVEPDEYTPKPTEETDESPSESKAPGSYTRCLWKGIKQTTNFVASFVIPKNLFTPLTLGSIATTIIELGKIVTDPEQKAKYWSSGGSLYRHPYPVGFKATKYYFNQMYTMDILAGDDGPIFKVTDASGRSWIGKTPTKPWTSVCLASSSKGTRISGPLFFGFSDPITQKMIEELEGYQSWDEIQAELEAAKAKESEEVESENKKEEVN